MDIIIQIQCSIMGNCGQFIVSEITVTAMPPPLPGDGGMADRQRSTGNIQFLINGFSDKKMLLSYEETGIPMIELRCDR